METAHRRGVEPDNLIPVGLFDLRQRSVVAVEAEHRHLKAPRGGLGFPPDPWVEAGLVRAEHQDVLHQAPLNDGSIGQPYRVARPRSDKAGTMPSRRRTYRSPA